jgi:hypothetical protein
MGPIRAAEAGRDGAETMSLSPLNRGTSIRCAPGWLVAGLVVAGCGGDHDDSTDTSRPGAAFGFQKSVEETLLAEGQAAYDTYCVGCHGAAGDGNGEAAGFLHPRPRNFQEANFKFSSTRSGRLPTDEDLKRTIRNGLKGSAMPAWDRLPDRTLEALVAHIKTFSPKWRERQPATAIPLVEDPYRSEPDKSEAVARGELVYHGYATCWTCHPAYVSDAKINEYLQAVESPARLGFRPDLRHSVGKVNTEGEMIHPPDFLRDFVRAGTSVDDLYRSVAAGITGTAMPTWVDSMEYASTEGHGPLVETADLWAIAYYVQSLIARRPAKLAAGSFDIRERMQKIYLNGEVPPPVVAPELEALEGGDFYDD